MNKNKINFEDKEIDEMLIDTKRALYLWFQKNRPEILDKTFAKVEVNLHKDKREIKTQLTLTIFIEDLHKKI